MTRVMFSIVIVIAVCIVGCSREPTVADKKKVQDNMRELILKPQEKKIELLALKYKLDPKKIEVVVRTYLANHDAMFVVLQSASVVDRPIDIPATKSISDTIAYLEREFGVPSDVLASIIIDYQVWEYVDWGRNKEKAATEQ